MERVDEQLTKSVHSRTVVDGIIREVVKQRQEAFKKLEESLQTPAPSGEEQAEAEPEQQQVTIEVEQSQEEEVRP